MPRQKKRKLKTLLQKYTFALELRGYKIDDKSRSVHYTVMTCREENDARPLTKGDHRVLIGRQGALRMTRRTLQDSISMADLWGSMLLAEVEKAKQAGFDLA